MGAEISICMPRDYNQILDDLADFWDGRQVRHLHHPMLIHEFGDSAYVIREGAVVAAYLFELVSQVEPVGYVHLIVVRSSARRRGLGQLLFDHFVEFARQRGCRHVKAVTTPANTGSIALHRSLGMELRGEPNAEGISVVTDYAGRGEPRVIFWKAI
jgi:GNAT superfamily N-acetyltransferase